MRYRPHRWPSRTPVKIKAGDGEFSALLIDVNREGARLRDLPEDALQPGASVALTTSGLRINAQIRWKKDQTAGLSFGAPLARPALARLRKTGAPRPV